MVLDDCIWFPDFLLLELNDLVYQSLDDSYSEIIVLGLIIMINSYKILMNSNEEFLHVHFFDEFIHDFTKLEQTFDDQSRKLWQGVVLLGFLQKAEEDAKNVSVITVFKHPEHWWVQILKYKLSFFVLANFIEIINKQSGKKLLDKIVYTLLRDFPHDLFGGAWFVDDSDKVFRESQRNVLNLVSENIFHDHCESINELIAAIDQSLQLILLLLCLLRVVGTASGRDNLIQSYEGIDSF